MTIRTKQKGDALTSPFNCLCAGFPYNTGTQ